MKFKVGDMVRVVGRAEWYMDEGWGLWLDRVGKTGKVTSKTTVVVWVKLDESEAVGFMEESLELCGKVGEQLLFTFMSDQL